MKVMSLLNLLPAVLGLVQGSQQANSANNLNRRALALQESQYNDFTKPVQAQYLQASKMIMDAIARSQSAGAYDPQRIMENMRQEHDLLQGRAMGNRAAALRTAGYKTGDTEVLRSLTDLGDKFDRDLAFKSNDIAQQTPLALAQALGAALNPAGAAAAQGMSAASHLAGAMNQRAGQMDPGDPSGLLASIMPFLQSTGQAGANQGPSGTVMKSVADLLAETKAKKVDNSASSSVLSGLVTKVA